MTAVPQARIRLLNFEVPRPSGEFVLYWMIAFRRPVWNFALQRAVEVAVRQRKPLVILEALRCDYRWASDRLHRFIIEGMVDNAETFAKQPVTYYPYIEPQVGQGRGLIQHLADRAVAVVTDDFPCFFLPGMIEAVGKRVKVAMEAIDSNGIYPMRDTDRVFTRAHYFRRHLQKTIRPCLREFPRPDPLKSVTLPRLDRLPTSAIQRWPPSQPKEWVTGGGQLASLPIDHQVSVVETKGGAVAASARLKEFLHHKIDRYGDRNQPEQDVSSGLSPYLHFGHVSAHEIVHGLLKQEQWTESNLREKPNGSAEGWWGLSAPAEGFLDELITWRELGYNMCWQQGDFDQYESLPEWAQVTLEQHGRDPRQYVYSLEAFETARSHDALWNAAQRQLVTEGRMHNYLRMLWGKKILEWSRNPRAALDVMIELNNKYALDGRNPNSYSGIFWVLGRYDRPWGPEREIFGKIRYMSSENTARKVRVKDYIQRYSPGQGQPADASG